MPHSSMHRMVRGMTGNGKNNDDSVECVGDECKGCFRCEGEPVFGMPSIGEMLSLVVLVGLAIGFVVGWW